MMYKELLRILPSILFLGLMGILGPPETLDAKLFYSAEQARNFFASLDLVITRSYLTNEILDIGLIISYSSLFYVWFLKLFPLRKKLAAVTLIPGAFDLVETSTILSILIFSIENELVFSLLGISTLLKWSSVFVFATSLLVKLVLRLTRPSPKSPSL